MYDECYGTWWLSVQFLFVMAWLAFPINTRRYMNVDSTFFERYRRQNNVVFLMGCIHIFV